MYKIIYVLIFLLMVSSVSAITFDKDTTYTEGNIEYIFKQGIRIDSFDISPGGIKIDGDEKMGLTIQGGELQVTFYQFDDITKEVGFKSSVPQNIEFRITSGGINQYLYDGDSYYVDNFYIETEEVIFTYEPKEESELTTMVNELSDSVTRLNWWQKKMVEFETSSSINDRGIIENETFSITYLSFTIIMVLIIFITIMWRMLSHD